MGEFNSDDHYIYYRGQETSRETGGIIVGTRQPLDHREGRGLHQIKFCLNYAVQTPRGLELFA